LYRSIFEKRGKWEMLLISRYHEGTPMKTLRLLTSVFVIFFSVWKPAAVIARTQANELHAARTPLVSLTIINRSFGAMQVSLVGSAGSYSFYVVQGKTTYQIAPGKYTYTIQYASNNLCKGWHSTKFGDYLIKTRKFLNLKNTLGPYRYCSLK
jgi:hypothetical protein